MNEDKNKTFKAMYSADEFHAAAEVFLRALAGETNLRLPSEPRPELSTAVRTLGHLTLYKGGRYEEKSRRLNKS